MNDYCLSLLEQYDIEVLRTRKGRGAYIVDTPREQLIFKEYIGTEEKARLQNRLLMQIEQAGKVSVEKIIPTMEEALLVQDICGNRYMLKTYPEGRELNIGDEEECAQAVYILARLHESMVLKKEETEEAVDGDSADGKTGSSISAGSESVYGFRQQRYEKGRKELRHVRKFLQQRSQKTDFELSLLSHYGYFQEQADRVCSEWESYSKLAKQDENVYCHGDFQYHNILLSDSRISIINFEKFVADNQVRDLYLLMRKLLEKSNWSVELGKRLLESYEQARALSAIDRIDLYYRLAYPEKFRKIVNFYYNSGKAWIPGRNQEKLDKVVEQEKEKQNFLNKVFREVNGGV